MRLDVPTLQCDRCKYTTKDTDEMSKYRTLTGMYDGYQSAREKWDLCPPCYQLFLEWIGAQ
jgi:hypothetical protein